MSKLFSSKIFLALGTPSSKPAKGSPVKKTLPSFSDAIFTTSNKSNIADFFFSSLLLFFT